MIRLRPRDLTGSCEVNVSTDLTIVRDEARTPLLRKTCSLDSLGHTQSSERVVGSRQQRLPDMESRERFALKENDRMTKLTERDGRRRTSWTATGRREIKGISSVVPV